MSIAVEVVTVAPEWRGRGLGAYLLVLVAREFAIGGILVGVLVPTEVEPGDAAFEPELERLVRIAQRLRFRSEGAVWLLDASQAEVNHQLSQLHRVVGRSKV